MSISFVFLACWGSFLFVVHKNDNFKSSNPQTFRWLRHCATSQKVAGSIPDGVIEIFHLHNPSGRTMALGLTQPLTEISTRNISRGYRRQMRTADNLTSFMCRLSWNLGASTTWNPQGLPRLVMGLLYLLPLPQTFHIFLSDNKSYGLKHVAVPYKNSACLASSANCMYSWYLTLRWLMSYIYIWSTHSWCF